VVPDVRGLFVGPCLRAVGDIGLRMETVRLTEFPMPVEGLIVGQSPSPGTKVRRSGTLTVQVWHPPRRPAANR
jgi:beta-lactam-binding protein with PASTA domain